MTHDPLNGARWRVDHGDALDVLRGLGDGCVDFPCMDPPYGLDTLNTGEWDREVPPVEVWREVKRVSRPGAVLLATGGRRTVHRMTCAIEDAGWRIADGLIWLFAQGRPPSKTHLRPAWEPIVCAVNGDGPLPFNIEACRIPVVGQRPNKPPMVGEPAAPLTYRGGIKGNTTDGTTDRARWPVNALLCHAPECEDGGSCVDGCPVAALDEQAGECRGAGWDGVGVTRNPSATYGHGIPAGRSYNGEDPLASRYFNVFRYEPKARFGQNHGHPTAKPESLVRWMVRLGCPPGGLVADFFCGSGTTGVAALAEGCRFIGCDREAAYAEMSRARIAGTAARPLGYRPAPERATQGELL